jgi:hypothetical protein
VADGPRNTHKTMANETSFNLNLAVQRWRENLAQSPAFRSENLNELESHLRDSVATLQAKGLTAEEAFWIAGRRAGDDKELETEFGKVNGRGVWLDRVFWILIGWLVWDVVSSLIRTVTYVGLAFGWKMTNHDYGANSLVFPVVLSVLIQLTGFAGSLVFCWWLLTRKAKKMGRWFQPFLSQPLTLALGCAVLWAIIFLSRVLVPLLFVRLYGTITEVKIMAPLNISSGIVSITQMMALVVITLWLARKRVRGAGA